MLPVDTASRNKSHTRGETKWPGLCRHAEALSVHRNHLWMVLDGRRQSKRLIKRYVALLKKEGRHIPDELNARA